MFLSARVKGAKENEKLEVTKFERKRKNNFTVNDTIVITRSQSKLTNTNKRKSETWEEITVNINS